MCSILIVLLMAIISIFVQDDIVFDLATKKLIMKMDEKFVSSGGTNENELLRGERSFLQLKQKPHASTINILNFL